MRSKALIVGVFALGALCVPALAAPPEGTYLVEYNSGLNQPYTISWEASGSLLIADTSSHRIMRRSPNGTLTRVAGRDIWATEREGFSGDGGPATDAQLRYPRGVAALPDGGFLIADSDNHRIRRVFPNGTIETVAGGGYNGDGCDARRVYLGWPTNVEPTPDGGFLITDTTNSRIRRVWPDGSITTVAGNNMAPIEAEGGPATQIGLDIPRDVSVTQDGGFLIADEVYNRILGVSPGGTVTRVAGTGERGGEFSGDGGPATAAHIKLPQGVAATRDGGFVIADSYNGRLRAVSPQGTIDTISEGGYDVALAPGGGAAFTIPGNDIIKFTANSLRPAMPPAVSGGFRGTGGFAGACLGMDPRFGGGSARSSLAGEPARGLVAQAQNRIVAADRGGRVVRHLPDGTADHSFGSGGVARSPFTWTWGVELGRQPGGGLVLAANVANEAEVVQAGVMRFTADGALDRSFGSGAVAGAATLSAGSTVKAMDVAPDGKVLISGRGIGPGTFFARFTLDGRLDPAFGSGGICHSSDQWGPATAGLEVADGDRFYELSSGDPSNEPAGHDIAVTRYTANCRPDPTYGQGGTIHLNGAPWAAYDGRDLALQPDGKLVVAGHSEDSTDPRDNGALVARFNPDGSLDRSFAGDGVATMPQLDRGFMDSRTTVAQAIALQPDGKIVVAGKEEHPDWEFQDGALVARLLPDGRLDPSLGAGGRLRTPLEYGGSLGTAIAVRPDGDIVVSAESYYQLTLIAYSGTRPPGAPGTVSGSTTPSGELVGEHAGAPGDSPWPPQAAISKSARPCVGCSSGGTDGAPPTVADINVRFPEPLRLRPSMNGEIRAIGAAPFRGVARLRLAGRVVARQSIRGNFSTEWSPLRVRFPVRARRTVIRIAEREHRRPVLEISISARIDGRVTLRLRRFIVTL